MVASAQSTKERPAHFAVELQRNLRIPTGDPGISLAADLWLPQSDEQVPVLVMVLPYRRDVRGGMLHEPAFNFRYFAERGYACILVDTLGVGSSDGLQRSMLDPQQADDGVAAVEWAATQDWSNGRVGMWGHCAGGLTTMLTAARQPRALRAIIAAENPQNTKFDGMYPQGARSDVHNIARRGGNNLLLQLLPPVADFASTEEQSRWRQRLLNLDPWRMVGAHLPPDDPSWEAGNIDTSTFNVPAMCIGGWRDMYTNATIRAYEGISTSKKLLVGPWMHTMPHRSTYESIDFLPIALRWWDRWLHDADHEDWDESIVDLYVQGIRPEWRSYESWPPNSTTQTFSTNGGRRLAPSFSADETADPAEIIGEYLSDPTIGSLAGLQTIGCADERRLDQHDDDLRSLTVVTDELAEDLLVIGTVTVEVHLTPNHAPVRLVARLTEVEATGRSNLITGGVWQQDQSEPHARIELRRTAYRVSAGSRIRIALSDSEFPWLRPLPTLTNIQVRKMLLHLPTVAVDHGETTEMPIVANKPSSSHWRISRDPIQDTLEVEFGSTITGLTPHDGHSYEQHDNTRSVIERGAPDAAVVTGDYTAAVQLVTGETVTAKASVRCTETAAWIKGEVSIDDLQIFSQSWETSMPEHFVSGA